MDAKFDKDIMLSQKVFMNIYFEILNVLNSKNILSVYRATGNPEDDGYLASPEAQPEIAIKTDSQAFTELYQVRVNSPGNYSLPRRLRLGVALNF
jgi:hypothetical protein